MSGADRNSDDKTGGTAPPDQGRAGWEQVGAQDQLHWTEGNTGKDESISTSDAEDHGRNANLDHGPRDDDGFSEYQARKDDSTPDSNWDLDDYRRTEFAGSRDGTNHPTHPPDNEGQPPLTLRPD
jgi:hypothetical protein